MNRLRWAFLLAGGALLGAGAAPNKNPPAPPVPAAVTGPTIAAKVAAAPKGDYAVIRTIDVPGDGMWASLTLAPDGKLLYIPRNLRTQVLDVATGKLVAEIVHGNGAACVALAPGAGRGFISNNRDGTITVFDLKSFDTLGKINVGNDPGAIIYDPASKRVFVSCAMGKVIIPFAADMDLKTGKLDSPIPMEGKPDSMVADGQGMVYVAVPSNDEVAVLDTRHMKIAIRWKLVSWYRPTGVSMDRVHNRLFVACRTHFVVLSATDGHILADIPAGAGARPGAGADSTVFCDGKAFVCSGGGNLSVIGPSPDGAFAVRQTLHLLNGGRSMTADPHGGLIYIPGTDVPGKRSAQTPLKIQVVEKK